MKKVYAVADKIPKNCKHLTKGKEYECSHVSDIDFEFIDDDGDERYSRWNESHSHLNGKNWRRIEREE